MAIAAGTALVACARTPPVPHTVLDESLDALRTAFDADSGKVRAIFLASPT
jgi:hypothetical protein